MSLTASACQVARNASISAVGLAVFATTTCALSTNERYPCVIMDYKNFTIEFPHRLRLLDRQFAPIASGADLGVTYLLMKLAAAFVLPYERVQGTSGARAADVHKMGQQSIRIALELDKLFTHSSYCINKGDWSLLDVERFAGGPKGWIRGDMGQLHLTVHKVLRLVRHCVAHSNLFFGGESQIEHVFLGSRREKSENSGSYRVIRCTTGALDHLIDAWLDNVEKLRVNPAMIWRELRMAA